MAASGRRLVLGATSGGVTSDGSPQIWAPPGRGGGSSTGGQGAAGGPGGGHGARGGASSGAKVVGPSSRMVALETAPVHREPRRCRRRGAATPSAEGRPRGRR